MTVTGAERTAQNPIGKLTLEQISMNAAHRQFGEKIDKSLPKLSIEERAEVNKAFGDALYDATAKQLIKDKGLPQDAMIFPTFPEGCRWVKSNPVEVDRIGDKILAAKLSKPATPAPTATKNSHDPLGVSLKPKVESAIGTLKNSALTTTLVESEKKAFTIMYQVGGISKKDLEVLENDIKQAASKSLDDGDIQKGMALLGNSKFIEHLLFSEKEGSLLKSPDKTTE